MTPDAFLESLKHYASDSAVDDTVKLFERPPGRRPAEDLLKLARWYSTLDETGKEKLREALRFATDTAVFGVLCILDGARAIEDSEDKGEFELYFVKRDNKQLLNPPADPLHEGYRRFMDNS